MANRVHSKSKLLRSSALITHRSYWWQFVLRASPPSPPHGVGNESSHSTTCTQLTRTYQKRRSGQYVPAPATAFPHVCHLCLDYTYSF